MRSPGPSCVLRRRQTVQPSTRPTRLTIDTIIVDNRNIFDRRGRSAGLGGRYLANGLHIRTRQWVIRRRLLLNRGDAFDRGARRGERAARCGRLGVFRQVRVDTVTVATG